MPNYQPTTKMKILSHIPSWLKNKYLLAGTFFLIWMFFFDTRDFPSTFSKRSKLISLKKSEKQMEAQIAAAQNERNLLKTSAQTIEKYARENFLMKKDNEDLFIIADPNSSK